MDFGKIFLSHEALNVFNSGPTRRRCLHYIEPSTYTIYLISFSSIRFGKVVVGSCFRKTFYTKSFCLGTVSLRCEYRLYSQERGDFVTRVFRSSGNWDGCFEGAARLIHRNVFFGVNSLVYSVAFISSWFIIILIVWIIFTNVVNFYSAMFQRLHGSFNITF